MPIEVPYRSLHGPLGKWSITLFVVLFYIERCLYQSTCNLVGGSETSLIKSVFGYTAPYSYELSEALTCNVVSYFMAEDCSGFPQRGRNPYVAYSR